MILHNISAKSVAFLLHSASGSLNRRLQVRAESEIQAGHALHGCLATFSNDLFVFVHLVEVS